MVQRSNVIEIIWLWWWWGHEEQKLCDFSVSLGDVVSRSVEHIDNNNNNNTHHTQSSNTLAVVSTQLSNWDVKEWAGWSWTHTHTVFTQPSAGTEAVKDPVLWTTSHSVATKQASVTQADIASTHLNRHTHNFSGTDWINSLRKTHLEFLLYGSYQLMIIVILIEYNWQKKKRSKANVRPAGQTWTVAFCGRLV